LRQVSIRGPAIGSLDLPLITTIGITGRERGITCTQESQQSKATMLSKADLTGWPATKS
jgi:hypothetical protein